MRGIVPQPMAARRRAFGVASTKSRATRCGGRQATDARSRGCAQRFQSVGPARRRARARARAAVGSDSPTTVCGSPSMRSMNGRAEAVDRERAGDLERLARRDVGVDLGVVDVGGEVHGRDDRARPTAPRTAPPRWSISQWPECRIAAARRAGRASARGRPRAGAACRRSTPSSTNAESPPRMSPSIGSPSSVRADDGLGLGRASSCTISAAASGPVGLAAATAASSSTSGRDRDRLDAGGAQRGEAGGRGRGEVEPHAPSCRSARA